VKQIETPRSPDPIMRRPRADREEKRVTRGSDTPGPGNIDGEIACLTIPNQRELLKPLGHPARFQGPNKLVALTQLRDVQFDYADWDLPVPVTVAVTLEQPLGALLS
jgi:hypothetical protein